MPDVPMVDGGFDPDAERWQRGWSRSHSRTDRNRRPTQGRHERRRPAGAHERQPPKPRAGSGRAPHGRHTYVEPPAPPRRRSARRPPRVLNKLPFVVGIGLLTLALVGGPMLDAAKRATTQPAEVAQPPRKPTAVGSGHGLHAWTRQPSPPSALAGKHGRQAARSKLSQRSYCHAALPRTTACP